jgi:hypothetical protein
MRKEPATSSSAPSSAEPQLFGEVALSKGFVSVAGLYEALTIQARAEARGEPYCFLGEILVRLGYMSEPEVLEVLHELHATENVV